MAQGLRGRLALLGAGVVLCSGLTGCMNDDKKTINQLPTAKGTGPAVPGGMTSTRQPGPSSGFTAAGPGGYTNPAGVQPASGAYPYDPMNGSPSKGNPGIVQRQAMTGQMGPGAPLPGPASNSYTPSVLPNTAGYQPTPGTGYQPQPSNYGSTNVPVPGSFGVDPVTGTTIRATAPTGSPTLARSEPPPTTLSNDPTPPPPPSSYSPPVGPADGAPLIPTPPPGVSVPMQPYGK